MMMMMTIMMMIISRHQIPIHDRLRSYDPSLENADSCTYPQHRLLSGTFSKLRWCPCPMLMMTRKCCLFAHKKWQKYKIVFGSQSGKTASRLLPNERIEGKSLSGNLVVNNRSQTDWDSGDFLVEKKKKKKVHKHVPFLLITDTPIFFCIEIGTWPIEGQILNSKRF